MLDFSYGDALDSTGLVGFGWRVAGTFLALQNRSKTLNDKTNVVHVNFGARAQTLKLAA